MQCNTFRYLLKPDKTRLARFKSGCHLHVGASCISLAPTFFKSQSALIPLLLLSNRDSLRWIRGRFLTGGETKLSRMKPPDTSEQSPLCSDVLLFLRNKKRHPPAPLLLLSESNPLRWASIRVKKRKYPDWSPFPAQKLPVYHEASPAARLLSRTGSFFAFSRDPLRWAHG